MSKQSTSDKKVSVIIIHWNTTLLLRQQLKSLYDNNDIELIVIDNASEESVDWIQQEYPNITLIRNKINRGYAFACNQGATVAQSQWILFLNPDVEINGEQVIAMIDEAHEKKFDACSPKPESKDYQKPVPTTWNLLAEFSPLQKIFRNASTTDVYTLTGGCLLIKSDVLNSLGGWDERFFVWFEDSDLTQRLVNNNFKIGWLDIAIHHQGGASFKKLSDQMKRDIFFHSMNIYAKKHFSSFGKLLIRLIKKRYSNRNVLPPLHSGVSISVPNMKPEILENFFSNNKNYLHIINELIIVTSGIEDTKIWNWRKKYPDVRFILLKKNRGVASTINHGLLAATGAWIGTVNDDTVLSNEWIEKCMECATPEVGVLNPLIFHPNNEMESAGVNVMKKGKAYAIKEIPVGKKCVETDAVNGAIVLYKNAALNKAGVFDERFGSYLEDIDLSLRIKRNGFRNIVCLNTKVIHIGHATSSQTIWKTKPWLDFRNWFYVIIKNWSLADLILHSPQIILERMRNLSGAIKSM